MALQLSEEDYELLNTHLAELEMMQKDIEIGKKIGVQNIEVLEQRCKDAKKRCVALKETCFPNRK